MHLIQLAELSVRKTHTYCNIALVMLKIGLTLIIDKVIMAIKIV